MQACVSFCNSLLYVLPLSHQWKILHVWLLMCPWKFVDQQIWEMVLYYCRYVSHVCCVYLSCACYEHGLHVDTHACTRTSLKIVTFVSYYGHTLFFWVFKLLWWCSQALSSCWVIVTQYFWDTSWSQLQGANVQFSSKGIWPLKMGPPCWPKSIGH